MMSENYKWKTDLIRDIRNFTPSDDEDRISVASMTYRGKSGEFSECNRISLTEQFLKVKDKCRSIVEIGVCRNKKDSSTYCFLNNKKDETIYAGIDLEDKAFLNNASKNIFTIKNNSADYENNMQFFKRCGISEIDFLFIDGNHSINEVLWEWEYTNILSEDGIVGFHDTSGHEGPYEFIRALDKNKWDVIENACPDDYGIGFAKRKKIL